MQKEANIRSGHPKSNDPRREARVREAQCFLRPGRWWSPLLHSTRSDREQKVLCRSSEAIA